MIAEGFIALDTETSGISFTKSEVIQVGAIFYDKNLKRIGSIDLNVNFPAQFVRYDSDGKLTSDRWSSEAEAVHGIPLDIALNHGVSHSELIELFNRKRNKFFNGIKDKDIVVFGANTYFDYVRMVNIWELAGEKQFPVSHRLLDLTTLGRFLLDKPSLFDILKHYNVEIDQAKYHSALYDCELHYEAFKSMYNEFGHKCISPF